MSAMTRDELLELLRDRRVRNEILSIVEDARRRGGSLGGLLQPLAPLPRAHEPLKEPK